MNTRSPQISSGFSASAAKTRAVLPPVGTLGTGELTLVHHWMEFFRGGEAVLEQFALLFPQAPISILVYNEKNLSPILRAHSFHTSFLQNQPFLKRHFRKLLPIFPEIISRLGVRPGTRFVLSTDASLIKGLPLPEGVPHVCYCHSPPRYLWGLEDTYLESSSHNNSFGRALFSAVLPRLRNFDRRVAQKVDRFIANSHCVQERILRCYERESVVIHPPVSVARFDATRPREDFYLIVSALVPYKYVQIAVDACTRLKRALIVIGTGPEEADLRRRAGPTITFLGWQSNESVKDHYERCRAFLFPGIEDFGITPCEAQAAGAPVIAFGEGGALETVSEGVSGMFFHQQTTTAMATAIREFEASPGFDPATCRRNVLSLGPERFRAQIREYLAAEFPAHFEKYPWNEAAMESATPAVGPAPAEIAPAAALEPRPGLSVLEVLEPGEGGAFRHVEGLVHYLLNHGVVVHLAYSSRRGSRRLIALAEKVRRHGGRVLNLGVINYPEFRDAPATWRLGRMVRQLQPDVIHAHSSKAGVLARIASLAHSASVVIYTPHAYYGMSHQPAGRRFVYNSVETVLAHVGTTINISRDEADFGQRVHGVSAGRCRIIPNPVDTVRFQPPTPAQRRAAREKLGLEDHHEVAGFVARTCWQKDPETAYLGIARMFQRHPNFRFVHVAWGNWKDYLLGIAREQGFDDRLQVLDYQEDPTSFYHAIDALLITSRYEAGWPFVVLEALACNLPVIAATCRGMSDLGHAGLSHAHTFAPEDRAGCAGAIEAWLAGRKGEPLPCNHRQYAVRHFSPESCFGPVLDTYRALSGGIPSAGQIRQLNRAGQPG
jgi:glycosyltransferase involved in cell wall biosynthesis